MCRLPLANPGCNYLSDVGMFETRCNKHKVKLGTRCQIRQLVEQKNDETTHYNRTGRLESEGVTGNLQQATHYNQTGRLESEGGTKFKLLSLLKQQTMGQTN